MSEPSPAAADPRPGRHCYKCGRPIGPDQTICAECNRAGMATPSATQYHGTIVVSIVAGVVLLAVWASLALRGVGPYDAAVQSVTASAPDGALVSVAVHNQGTRAGRAKCTLDALDGNGNLVRTKSALSPQVPPGESVSFEAFIPGLPQLPDQVTVSCT
jgi:predicted nucleic acid-binding Zn ribbon protein